MSDQAKVDAFDQLLRPGRLLALDSREFFLKAMHFARVEPALRERRSGQGVQAFKVSILSTLSAQHFAAALRLSLYSDGLLPEIYLSGFDGISSEGADLSSPFWSSAPDAVLILPASEDIKGWPRMFAPTEEIGDWVKSCAARYLGVWEQAGKRLPGIRIYQALLTPPLERPLGNLESRYPFSRQKTLAALNQYLREKAPPHVTLVDFEGLSGLVGRRQWVDETAYFSSKQPFSLREMPFVAAQFSRLMAAARGLVRKCLVVDLDNTLWGGVVGDDGVEGIRLDPNDPVGEAFLAFQRYLLALKERGVVLAVCSKNDPEIARSAFELNKDMLLKLDDFAVFVANWEDKAKNLRTIARQLNLGMDSLVFFDDSPAERSLVQQFEPQVLVIVVPEDPALFVRALDLSLAFEWHELTPEDLGRADTYAKNRARHELESKADDYEGYLRSLEMKAAVEPTGPTELRRVTQLANKTNQFNLRTKRYSEEELDRLLDSNDYDLLHVRLHDRFSNYGIIASVIIRYYQKIAFIENWVMSCRIFNRGVEDATFNAIVTSAKAHGAEWLATEYISTAKNNYVAGLPERLGLHKWEAGNDLPVPPAILSEWNLNGAPFFINLSDTLSRPHFIENMGSSH